jgi:hypothetical protein
MATQTIRSSSRTQRRAVALVCFLIWGVSLACPVAIMGKSHDNVFPGWSILMMGWLGVSIAQFGWFANIAFLFGFAILLIPKHIRLLDLAVSTIIIALCVDALLWREMCGDSGCVRVPMFGVGYYLWFFAMAGVSGALGVRALTTKPRVAA